MVTLEDYKGGPTAWCPGCGNFGILLALQQALVALELPPHQVLIVSGIGQAAKLPHYLKCNTLNGLHGRTLPVATGARLANHELTVIAVGGDGDGYGEGGNHFLHALRRNIDITYLVHNNQVYGLTKGQASPTSDPGFVTKTTPQGAPTPLNPLSVAIAAGGGFVARSFSGDIPHLSGLIQQAIQHRGFSLVDVLQPCVSFNPKNTFAWYRERVHRVEEPGHDPTDKMVAFARAQEWDGSIPIGVIYRHQRPTFEEELPALRDGALVKRKLEPGHVARLLSEFK
ncbi:MAG: 2-oxoacid:ferredoxin oxidoreductase subunit beta [Dehalococcoidia bacterium]